MNFHSLYDQGFARVAAVTLPVHPARPFENAREIIDTARELDARGVAVGVYPELCVSGYAIDDLLLQDVLLDTVEKALGSIVEASADLLPLLIVGAPLRKDNALYNCAVAIHRGRVLAIIPKSHLPNYREFYEKRYFVTMPPRACERIEVPWGGVEEFSGGPVWVPFGQVLISADDVPGLTVGIEICEDMWVPVNPGTELALAGATVLALAAGIVTDLPAVLQRALPDYTSALQRSADPGLSRGEGQRSACVDGATTLADCGALPSLKPTAWLNTDGGAAPQGSGATLVDFWAYSCINCQRSIPGIERLYEAYHPYGLQVIGVHSPEYAFEKETANVQFGGDKLGITYPIAVDSDLETWTDFDNHYWPAQYLADAHGQLRYTHFGEGGEATLESLIRRLLADQGNALPDPLFTDDGVEGVAFHRTPETYLGHERAASFAGTEAYSVGTRDYAAPATLGADRFALQGRWTIGAQSISPADDEAELRLMWRGRRVDLVVSGEGDLTWEMDGQSHTQHVSGTPNSMTLVSGDTDSSGLLTVTASKGLALYSFTFG